MEPRDLKAAALLIVLLSMLIIMMYAIWLLIKP